MVDTYVPTVTDAVLNILTDNSTDYIFDITPSVQRIMDFKANEILDFVHSKEVTKPNLKFARTVDSATDDLSDIYQDNIDTVSTFFGISVKKYLCHFPNEGREDIMALSTINMLILFLGFKMEQECDVIEHADSEHAEIPRNLSETQIKEKNEHFYKKLGQISESTKRICEQHLIKLQETDQSNTEAYYKSVFNVVIYDIMKHFIFKVAVKCRKML